MVVAVAALHAQAELAALSAREGGMDLLQQPLVVGMHEGSKGPLDEIRRGPAEQGCHRVGDPLGDAIEAAAEDHIGGVFREQAVALLGGGQPGAGAPLFAHVAEAEHQPLLDGHSTEIEHQRLRLLSRQQQQRLLLLLLQPDGLSVG